MGVGAISSAGAKKTDASAIPSKLGTSSTGNVLGYSTGINQ